MGSDAPTQVTARGHVYSGPAHSLGFESDEVTGFAIIRRHPPCAQGRETSCLSADTRYQ